jgi:hypothetical protein
MTGNCELDAVAVKTAGYLVVVVNLELPRARSDIVIGKKGNYRGTKDSEKRAAMFGKCKHKGSSSSRGVTANPTLTYFLLWKPLKKSWYELLTVTEISKDEKLLEEKGQVMMSEQTRNVVRLEFFLG